MGEAKQKNAKHLEAQDRSQREDAMHKRAQRAEGDLLKARAHITQLEAEAREARAEREEWMRAIDQANKNSQQYEALHAEASGLRDQLGILTTQKIIMQADVMGMGAAMDVMTVDAVMASHDLADMRNRLQAMHRRAQKAESARDAEKALADYLAEGVRDLYEHSQYLDRYRKARGL